MPTGLRLGLIAAGTGLIAGLALAVLPQSYTATAGPGEKAAAYEGQTQVVDCGSTFAPRNPAPPPWSDEECDATHIRRAIILMTVILTGIATGALVSVLAAWMRRRGEEPRTA